MQGVKSSKIGKIGNSWLNQDPLMNTMKQVTCKAYITLEFLIKHQIYFIYFFTKK